MDGVSIDWEKIDEPQEDTDEDWMWTAKWAWQRVAKEIDLPFKGYLDVAAEENVGAVVSGVELST